MSERKKVVEDYDEIYKRMLELRAAREAAEKAKKAAGHPMEPYDESDLEHMIYCGGPLLFYGSFGM